MDEVADCRPGRTRASSAASTRRRGSRPAATPPCAGSASRPAATRCGHPDLRRARVQLHARGRPGPRPLGPGRRRARSTARTSRPLAAVDPRAPMSTSSTRRSGMLGAERVTITDYKSSDVRDPARARQRARESLQLQIYAMGYEAMTGRLPGPAGPALPRLGAGGHGRGRPEAAREGAREDRPSRGRHPGTGLHADAGRRRPAAGARSATSVRRACRTGPPSAEPALDSLVMATRDRTAHLGLLGAALVVWILVALVVTTRDPVDEPTAGDHRCRAHRTGHRPDPRADPVARPLRPAATDDLRRRLDDGDPARCVDRWHRRDPHRPAAAGRPGAARSPCSSSPSPSSPRRPSPRNARAVARSPALRWAAHHPPDPRFPCPIRPRPPVPVRSRRTC